MGGLFAEDAKGMEGVMSGPLVLERVDGTVPDLALRMPLAHRQQFPLEIGLTDPEG